MSTPFLEGEISCSGPAYTHLLTEAAIYCCSFEQQLLMNLMQGGKTHLVSGLETISPNDIGFI